jgi:hypothetical protein
MCLPRRICDVSRLLLLPFGGHVLPKIRDGKNAIGTIESLDQRVHIIEIGLDSFRSCAL